MNFTIPIFLGLASAFAWGVSDFTGGLVSRRKQAVNATLYVEVLGLVLLFAIGLIVHEPGLDLKGWLWCAAAGAIGSMGVLALYSALARGQISLAAPVSAITSAAIPVILGFLIEGQPAWFTILGFLLALFSIVLISKPGTDQANPASRHQVLILSLLSGLGFGIYYIFIHQGSRHGIFWPMTVSRLSGTLVLLAYAGLTKQFSFPGRSDWPLVSLNVTFDIAGTVFYILASQTGRMDVAVVLGSLYSGVTILLARIFLSERLVRRQRLGILLAFMSIVFMTI
jgi:drug/metabolite transporter (DMT)-like permease